MDRKEIIDTINSIKTGILFDEIDDDPGFLRTMDFLEMLPFIIEKASDESIQNGAWEYNQVRKKEDNEMLENDKKSFNKAKFCLDKIIEENVD